MMETDIPGFGRVELKYLVSDFTGTLSVDGKRLPGIREQLNKLAESLEVHILTADTFGTVQSELAGVDCVIHILSVPDQDFKKEEYVRKLGCETVIAIGNGNNDRRMLKIARIGIAVTEGEGCSVAALMNAEIHVRNACDGLNLILNPERLRATLRF